MCKQRQLLDEMLARAQESVNELEPRIDKLVRADDAGLVTLEQAVFEAVMRLGASWLGLVLTLYAAQLAQATGTRLPCSCGGTMRWLSERTKTVLSLLGKVTYKRVYYYCSTCKRGQALGDRRWGLEHTRTTAGVARLIGYVTASLSFADTARQICRTLHWPEKWLSGKQVQRLARPIGRGLGQLEAEAIGQWWETVIAARSNRAATLVPFKVVAEALAPIKRLYVQMDGTMARFRGVLGQSSDVWHEIKVAAVFVAEPSQRVSHLAELFVGAAKSEEETLRVWVDRPQGPITYVAGRLTAAVFGVRVFAEATRRGLERAEEVVILGDGAHWIWELASEHFPGAVQILDFWHASEWVWKAAHAALGEGSARAARWAQEQIADNLIKGDAEGLVKAIEALPPVPPPPWANRSIPEQAAEYFRNNAGRMRYPEYRAKGMEIGSGTVESAGKRVVGQRCKGPGMRWSDDGLPVVLNLRTHVLNQRYDAALAALPQAS